MPRYFTLEQVRETLPRTERLIRQAIESKQSYEACEEWSQNFVRRVMMLGGVLADRAPFERNRSQQNRSASKLKTAVEEIQSSGVLIKDLDTGLVDFPTLFRGDEVYICWRLGEEEIGFWHGVHEGFAGRKTIDQEFLDNHRGRDAY